MESDEKDKTALVYMAYAVNVSESHCFNLSIETYWSDC